MNKSLIKGIRWFARILGALVVLFVLLSGIADIIDPPPQATGKISARDIPLMAGFIFMVGGIIIAWFREGLGGWLIIGGFIFFFAVESITSKSFDAWAMIIFPVIGLLHLFCWWQSKKSVQT